MRRWSDRIWIEEAPLRFYGVPFGTRMTVVRLEDGGLLVHSPMDPASPGSDGEADRAHQLDGVALLDDSGANPVVEGDLAVLQVILEVDIGGARSE